MAIVKWSPWHELEAVERRMRRMLDLPLGSMALPSADVYETDTEWVVQLEVPGFEEKDLSVEVVGETVRVVGHREEAKEEQKKAFHVKERLESSFERRFMLPAGSDSNVVSANFDKGVLELRAPLSAEGGAQAKSIEIGKKV